MNPSNKPIVDQSKALIEIFSSHNHISKLMEYIQKENMIENWYVCGGCIPTITWNHFTGNPLNKYLNDIDLIYYDTDLSKDKEQEIRERIIENNANIPFEIDLKNQARMHRWLEEKLGHKINQFQSSEEGINNWLSVTSIGLTRDENGIIIYSPYGLDDLFSMTVRPNKRIMTEDHYNKKIKRWKSQWDELTIIPW